VIFLWGIAGLSGYRSVLCVVGVGVGVGMGMGIGIGIGYRSVTD